MVFTYRRTVHFADTDAAGVVFFANYLAICHEAYEEALGAGGIELNRFFRDTGTIVPISKSETEYLRALVTGDRLEITVAPRQLSDDSFEIRFEMFRAGPARKRVAVARTEHVCLESKTRSRAPLPAALLDWIRASV